MQRQRISLIPYTHIPIIKHSHMLTKHLRIDTKQGFVNIEICTYEIYQLNKLKISENWVLSLLFKTTNSPFKKAFAHVRCTFSWPSYFLWVSTFSMANLPMLGVPNKLICAHRHRVAPRMLIQYCHVHNCCWMPGHLLRLYSLSWFYFAVAFCLTSLMLQLKQ